MPLRMHQEEMPTINLTPMIDIIFQLIIFFMVGSRFTEMDKKIEVSVPQVSKADQLPTAPTRCVVAVQKTGQLSLNGNPVTLESLVVELKALRAAKAELNVIVRGDADAPLQIVASALAACRNAGISDVGIAVRPGGTKERRTTRCSGCCSRGCRFGRCCSC
jgi:biopolymer transport protein ExbD